ncbi:MAG: hypothetical protein ACI4JD_06735 [Ruminococcus sp.]
MKDKRNWGKEIKNVGILLIVVGAIMLGMILFALASGGNQSIIYQIVDRHFIFLMFGGLILLLVGIITRSVGKSKELKFNSSNESQ